MRILCNEFVLIIFRLISTAIPVLVLRDETYPHTLCVPWPLTIISAPAVNAGVARERMGIEAEDLIHLRY